MIKKDKEQVKGKKKRHKQLQLVYVNLHQGNFVISIILMTCFGNNVAISVQFTINSV